MSLGGFIRKGGTNPAISQITERPSAPAPMSKPAKDEAPLVTTANAGVPPSGRVNKDEDKPGRVPTLPPYKGRIV